MLLLPSFRASHSFCASCKMLRSPRLAHKRRYTLGDKLQQQVAATDHSMCRGPSTSCRNTLRRHVQRQIASCVQENFCENLFLCNRVLSQQQVAQFCLIWFFATCCSNKIMLRRQRFSQKFSSTHEAICRCDVSLQRVAATCRQVCTDLKAPVMQANVLQQ